MRAVIGDQLRMPIVWCEMAACVSWHADPASLGEADVRARAITAGWRVDAFGLLACPRCQQTAPSFRSPSPVALWDRYQAMTMAARAAAPGGGTSAASGAEGSAFGSSDTSAVPDSDRAAPGNGAGIRRAR